MSGLQNEAPDCAGRNGAHTPGPWVACYAYGPDEKDGTVTIDAEEWGCLARVVVRMEGEQENTPEGEANARLIAAAPDMLEALKIVAGSDNWRCFVDEEWDIVNDAIAKAEGRP